MSSKQPIILIDNYDSFTYNLFQMIQGIANELDGQQVQVYRNDAITLDELMALNPAKIVLSPGPGHPEVATDIGVCRDIILQHERLSVPTLGVCLGYQSLVMLLGGTIQVADKIVHGKTSAIDILKPSKLFDGLPNPFTAMRYHSLVAAEQPFPDELEIIAREPKSQYIMAVQHKTRPLYGVQFHPESIGTPEGATLLRNFLEKCTLEQSSEKPVEV